MDNNPRWNTELSTARESSSEHAAQSEGEDDE